MNTNSAPLPGNPAAPRTTDHLIDRALSTLRDATPRAGLNSRILTSLEHRATQSQPARLHFFARLALWPALAACVMAVASFAILHHHTAPTDLAHSATPQSPASPQPRVPQVRGPQRPQSLGWHVSILRPGIDSPRSSIKPTLSINRHPERDGVPGELARRGARPPVFVSCADHHTGCPIHDDNVILSGVTTTSADPDAQAIADLHAPSHPAPPLPLTPQEKLFLRILRYGNATELAELNPAVRAAHDAEETTAFKTFFPDPPPLKQPGDDE